VSVRGVALAPECFVTLPPVSATSQMLPLREARPPALRNGGKKLRRRFSLRVERKELEAGLKIEIVIILKKFREKIRNMICVGTTEDANQ
jgi:hypothetical protein